MESLGIVAFKTGDAVRAGEHYRRALAINQRLTETEPKNPDYQNYLATVYAHLGELSERGDELDQASMYFRKSSVVFERLAGATPNNPAYSEPIAANNGRLALIVARQESLVAASDSLAYQASGQQREAQDGWRMTSAVLRMSSAAGCD